MLLYLIVCNIYIYMNYGICTAVNALLDSLVCHSFGVWWLLDCILGFLYLIMIWGFSFFNILFKLRYLYYRECFGYDLSFFFVVLVVAGFHFPNFWNLGFNIFFSNLFGLRYWCYCKCII